jgi:hypothetical protein
MDPDATDTSGMAVEELTSLYRSDQAAAGGTNHRAPWTRRVASMAGPLLIGGAVLLVLNGYAFRGLISISHPDFLPFWFPTWCYLGKTLAAGHIAAWNPHVMGGVPFAADPQSGWGYAPAMALFAALPCGVAIRWITIFHPLLAGLGLFAFLRSEGVSRNGATVGGLAISLGVAGSGFVTYMPFAGMFAWTPVLLAAASRLLRSSTWSSRIAWLVATALAWGQLAASHMSDGLIVGTGALACFALVRLVGEVRTNTRLARQAWALGGLLVVILPLVNLAVLLPRLSYLPETSLGQGYRALQVLNAHLTDTPIPRQVVGGYEATTPLSFSASGGVYLGAVALGLMFAGWRVAPLRRLWLSFSVFAVASYLVGSHFVAKAVAPLISRSVIGTFYSHAVHRLSWGLIIAIPVLAAIGVDAWRERAGPGTRVAMAGPAVLVWVVAPLALGLHRQHPLLPAVAAAVALLALLAVAFRPSVVLLIPLVLAAELTVNGLTVKSSPCCDDIARPPPPSTIVALVPGDRPSVPAEAYERAGPIVRALQSGSPGRYVSIDPALGTSSSPRSPAGWPLMATQRSMLFGLEEAQGYNPAQLMRYWRFVRAVQHHPITYNAAYFVRAEPLALNLLQVAYVVQPSIAPPPIPGATPVAAEGKFTLYVLPSVAPRASVVTSWEIAGAAQLALARVLRDGFDPNAQAVIEKGRGSLPPSGSGTPGPIGSPGGSAGPTATAQYVAEGEQAARVLVDAPTSALILVRNVFDRNWHATVDGRPAPVLAADSLIQAVEVGAGRHVIRLSYDDPAAGYGLLGSALVLATLLFITGALAVGERRSR